MSDIDYCNRISELLRNIDSKVAKISNQHYSQQSLTAPQINILLLLDKLGAMRVSDIAKELEMVDSNVSAICTRLENMGLIERIRQKEDQRVVKIQLTKIAVDKMKDITASVSRFQELIVKHVSEKDLEDIVLGLTKLNHVLDLSLEEEQK